MATFGQNVGLVTVTKVINKYVLVFASVILLIAGFVPKVAALLTTIPYAVLVVQRFQFCFYFYDRYSDDCFAEMTPRNTGVVGTALAFGIGVTLSTGSLAGFQLG